MGNALQDVMASRIDLGIFSTSVVESSIRAGKVKPIAVVADKRLPAFPDLPAVSETVPGVDFGGWYMVLAPANTPTAIVARMNEALDRATRDARVLNLAPKLGMVIEKGSLGSPESATRFLSREFDVWKKIIQELDIKPQ